MSYEFNTTRWTLVIDAAVENEQGRVAMDSLCRAYWPPLFAYVRGRGHSHADAEDMTQAFFHHLLAHQAHTHADKQRGRFRTYLLSCLKNFMINAHRNATADKRGGKEMEWLPLEEVGDEAEKALGGPATPEILYDRQFAHTMLAQALDHLRAEYFAAGSLARFDSLRPLLFESGYGEQQEHGLAAKLGTTDSAARTALSRFRQRYAEMVRGEIMRLVSDPADADDEISHLIQSLRE